MRLRIGPRHLEIGRLEIVRREIVCQQAVELVTDYLEGTLPRAARRRFEKHLAACPHCTEYLAQIRATIRLAGSVTPGDLTPQMQDEFIALFRSWQSDPGEGEQDRR
jgi:anti-sigma factor RsiW